MSVIQMSPCVLSNQWSDFVAWIARVFDMPVACRFDEQGWGRLAATSPGVTAIDARHFESSAAGRQTVIELEVHGIEAAVQRAVEQGGTLITEPIEVAEDGWHAAVETPQEVLLFLWEDRSSSDKESSTDIHQGPVNFTVARRIAASPQEVFEAATVAEHQKKYFIDDSTGDFGSDDIVTWTWDEHGDFDLHQLEFRPNEFVAFSWEAGSGPYHTRVQFAVTSDERGARLAVTESGWDADVRGQKAAFDNCEGWTSFLSNLRFYLEHGIESNA